MLKRLKSIGWRLPLLALLLGGVIHIFAVLAVPRLAGNDAYRRLASSLPVNAMTVLPPITPEAQPLPFLSPDFRIAVCRYDIAAGPVVINAVLPEPGWTMGFYAPGGDNFFLMPASEGRPLEVNFDIVQLTERFFGLLASPRSPNEGISQITVPTREGLIVIRAPIPGEAYAAQVEAQLRRSRCAARQR